MRRDPGAEARTSAARHLPAISAIPFRRSLCRKVICARPLRADPRCSAASTIGAMASMRSRAAPGERRAARGAARRRARRPAPRRGLDPGAGGPSLSGFWAYLRQGGAGNAGEALRFMSAPSWPPARPADPARQAAFGAFPKRRFSRPGAPRALIVFYRSAWLAGDRAPIEALADALRAEGFAVDGGLCDEPQGSGGLAPLRALPRWASLRRRAQRHRFSARLEDGARRSTPATRRSCKCGVSLATKRNGARRLRGLSPSDLAMNVALPEIDGRLFAGAISFKAPSGADRQSRICAARASAACRPRRLCRRPRRGLGGAAAQSAGATSGSPACSRTIPQGGRAGYAVGLDTSTPSRRRNRRAPRGYDVATISMRRR